MSILLRQPCARVPTPFAYLPPAAKQASKRRHDEATWICCSVSIKAVRLRRLKQLLGDNGESTRNVRYGEQANLELVEPKRGQTPLLLACADGNFTFFSYLLSRGARVDVAERGGSTPLHYLCLFGRLDLVRQLLELPDYSPSRLLAATDKDGWTPYMVAAMYKRADVTRYLIEETLVSHRIET